MVVTMPADNVRTPVELIDAYKDSIYGVILAQSTTVAIGASAQYAAIRTEIIKRLTAAESGPVEQRVCVSRDDLKYAVAFMDAHDMDHDLHGIRVLNRLRAALAPASEEGA